MFKTEKREFEPTDGNFNHKLVVNKESVGKELVGGGSTGGNVG